MDDPESESQPSSGGELKHMSYNSDGSIDWKKMWDDGRHPWHLTGINPLLVKHFHEMCAGKSAKLKVFVPMCGKDESLIWLLNEGHTVVGVEYSNAACQMFFCENSFDYTKEPFEIDECRGDLYKSTSGNLHIYCCDFFTFSSRVQKDFDVIWDRGALTTMKREEDQKRYVSVLKQFLVKGCVNLTEIMCGKGSSNIDQKRVTSLYAEEHSVQKVESTDSFNEHFKQIGIDKCDLYKIQRV